MVRVIMNYVLQNTFCHKKKHNITPKINNKRKKINIIIPFIYFSLLASTGSILMFTLVQKHTKSQKQADKEAKLEKAEKVKLEKAELEKAEKAKLEKEKKAKEKAEAAKLEKAEKAKEEAEKQPDQEESSDACNLYTLSLNKHNHNAYMSYPIDDNYIYEPKNKNKKQGFWKRMLNILTHPFKKKKIPYTLMEENEIL